MIAAQVAARSASAQTMRAARIVEPGRVELEDVALPEPTATQIRVRLEGCGICGSNLPVWQGKPWFTYPLPPGAPGHEGWGRVDVVGADVQGIKVGDRVAALSMHAFAEYDVVEPDACVVLPETLADVPFPGEPLGCAVNAFRRSDIQAGQNVAVIGIGFLGALLTQLGAKAGARVLGISRRPFSLEVARRCGAAEVTAMDDHWRIIERVKQWTGGEGCDRVIEAVGEQWPLDLAGELTRVRGKLIIAGYHQDGPRQVNMQQWNWRGLDVINAHERDPKIYQEGMSLAVEAVAAGRLDPLPLLTHRFSLDDLGAGLSSLAERPDGFLKGWVQP